MSSTVHQRILGVEGTRRTVTTPAWTATQTHKIHQDSLGSASEDVRQMHLTHQPNVFRLSLAAGRHCTVAFRALANDRLPSTEWLPEDERIPDPTSTTRRGLKLSWVHCRDFECL
jgi:hypothetical protein